MKRTNISLEEWQYEFLKEQANREGTSMSGLIREMIEEYAAPSKKGDREDPVYDIVGLGEGTGEPLSRDHDRHLYNTQKTESGNDE